MSSTERLEQPLLTPEPTNANPETIDPVIGPPHHDRPKLNSKPSWVGPLPHSHAPSPNARAMSQKVSIKYSAPGLQPPVYITTSLSDAQWEVIEMEVTQHGDGFVFHKDFDAAEGEYQYKFRLGPGDWWVCDENQPTVDDGDGNRNNILSVTRDSMQSSQRRQPAADAGPALSNKPSHLAEPERKAVSLLSPQDSVLNMSAMNGLAAYTEKQEHTDYEHEHDAHDEPVPLLKHETSYPGQVDDVPDGTMLSSPLSSTSSKSSIEDVVCPEADPEDTTLQNFPTDHASIVKEIQRTQLSLPEDITVDQPAGSPLSRTTSAVSALTSPLPSVQEEDAEPEILVMISDSEEDAEDTVAKSDKEPDSHHSRRHHHHKPTQQADDSPKTSKNHLADLGEIFFGIAFASVVAIVAFIMYSTGTISQKDGVKDGGAALGS